MEIVEGLTKEQQGYFDLAKANKLDPAFKKLATAIYAKAFLNNYDVNKTIVDFEYIETIHSTSLIKGTEFYSKLAKAMPFENSKVTNMWDWTNPSNQENVFIEVLDYCDIKINPDQTIKPVRIRTNEQLVNNLKFINGGVSIDYIKDLGLLLVDDGSEKRYYRIYMYYDLSMTYLAWKINIAKDQFERGSIFVNAFHFFAYAMSQYPEFSTLKVYLNYFTRIHEDIETGKQFLPYLDLTLNEYIIYFKKQGHLI